MNNQNRRDKPKLESNEKLGGLSMTTQTIDLEPEVSQ